MSREDDGHVQERNIKNMNSDKPLLKLFIATQIIMLLVKFELYQDLHWCIVLLPLEICFLLVIFSCILIIVGLNLQHRSKTK